MPPPIQQQGGSRAALVTWTVITSILFVVATVLAIFNSVNLNKKTTELDTLRSRYNEVISESDLGGDVKRSLTDAKTANPAYRDLSLINVARAQTQNLVRKIAGPQAASEAEAVTAADAALAQLADIKDGKVNGDSLISGVTTATAALKAAQTEIASLTAARDSLNKQIAGLNATFQQQLAAKDEDIAAAGKQATGFQDQVGTVRSDAEKQIQEIQEQAAQTTKLAQDDVNRLQAQSQELSTRIKQKEAVEAALQNKLRGLRQPVDQIASQVDARIIRVAANGYVFIDLGSGDQVVPGMSFEIYDRVEGIPKIGDPTNDENLPKGKASIEIIRVTPGSSEARVIRTTPGQQVVEGDLCVNLVYDRNTKYNVMVYGNFDLDRNGQATASDAEVIKRLVIQWGGQVTDKLDVNTDFLVLGKVPEVPNYSQEELEQPEIVFEKERRTKELNDYDDLLSKAIALNIPVLNQNRFLYFTGYYEQSAR